MALVPKRNVDWWDNWNAPLVPYRPWRWWDTHDDWLWPTTTSSQQTVAQQTNNTLSSTWWPSESSWQWWPQWDLSTTFPRDFTSPTLNVTKDKFQVTLDVKPFAAHELTVRTTATQEIVIEGKHDKNDGRYNRVERQFVRRYQLPAYIRTYEITASLSSDGYLTITAPLGQPKWASNERNVPILRL